MGELLSVVKFTTRGCLGRAAPPWVPQRGVAEYRAHTMWRRVPGVFAITMAKSRGLAVHASRTPVAWLADRPDLAEQLTELGAVYGAHCSARPENEVS